MVGGGLHRAAAQAFFPFCKHRSGGVNKCPTPSLQGLPLLVFALRDSAAAPKGGAARTSGGTLAGGATRIRGASGTERARAAMSSPAPVPKEIHRSAQRGELQKVAKWLRKGGLISALCPITLSDGQTTAETLLHAAAGYDQLEMVRELLKRGASVDLPSSLGGTALMDAAGKGHSQLCSSSCSTRRTLTCRSAMASPP